MKNLKIENLNLQILLEIHKSLNLHYDMHRVLNLIMDFAIELTQAERGFLILEKGGHLEYKVARTAEKKPIDSPESEVSRSIIHTVLTQKTSLIAHDAKDQKQFEDSVSINDLQLRSVICIPLTHKEKILGVLYLDNRQKKEVFSTIDLDLLIAFSHFSGVALGRALLYEQLRKKNQELVHSKRRLENLNQELELLNQKLEKKWKVEEQVLNEATQNLMQQESASAFKELVGVSEPMRHVFNLLKKVIDSSVPVFILGETGTGKEQIARILHQYGPRSPFPFYAENCSSTDKHFLENEFFGHEKGAFTHAQTQRAGLFELAHQGTLFLDEISEMPLDLQKKLLRVLQEEKIRRVGGHEEIPIDVRILCASKHDLRPLIAQGKFREDLYYRIHVIQIQLPPLRERQEDIYLLALKFLEDYAQETQSPVKRLDKSAVSLFEHYAWPGNVRELQNVVFSVAATVDRQILSAKDFRSKLQDSCSSSLKRSENQPLCPPLSLQEYSTKFILYHQNHYNDSELAKKLGISRKTLWDKRKKWGIARPHSPKNLT